MGTARSAQDTARKAQRAASGYTPQWADCGPIPLQPLQRCPQCKGAQAIVTDKCNDIPGWIYHSKQPCLAKTLIELDVIEDAWANSAILNTYHKAGGKLMQHADSCHLFVRPIVGLSLFNAKSLSFGIESRGMATNLFTLQMPRGAITIMEGYAANKINHGVRPVKRKTATLLLRRVFPGLLSNEWRKKNTMRWNIESPAPAKIPDRTNDVADRGPAPCSAVVGAAEFKPDRPRKRAGLEDGPAERKRHKANGDNAPPNHGISTGASSSSTVGARSESKKDTLGELCRQHVLGTPAIDTAVEVALPDGCKVKGVVVFEGDGLYWVGDASGRIHKGIKRTDLRLLH